MTEPYMCIEITSLFRSKSMPEYSDWGVRYTNYQGQERQLWVQGRDELAAYKEAIKILAQYKRRADVRRIKKKEQTNGTYP